MTTPPGEARRQYDRRHSNGAGATRQQADDYAARTPVSKALREVRTAGRVNPLVLDSLADQAEALERRAEAQVAEPPIYGAGSPHSWFRDTAAVTIPGAHIESDGGADAAARRLRDSAAYEHRRTERAILAANCHAESATEAAITATRREMILYERWRQAGGRIFEQRAINRTPGTGGDFAPPGWLVDRFVHAPRAGAPFAALWTMLPMPMSPGISSVNLPRVSVGGQSGAMLDGASVPSRDLADGTIKATLVTIAAQIDASLQWLDQTPLPPDESLGADLAEDFAIQLDGQLLLGSGSSGQALGVIPGGTFSAANSVWLQNTANAVGMSWANGAGATPGIAGSMHTSAAQLRSKIRRARGLAPTAWVVPPAVMDTISGSGVDAQDRPLNPPGMASAGDVPMLHWTAVVEDANIPLTFGGGTPPTIGSSAGITSPTDGNGTFAPLLLGRWADCFYWQSAPRVRVLTEVLSGTLQARFQVECYIAAIPNRIQWAGGNVTYAAANQGGGVNTGAAASYGVLTQTTANGILAPAAAGY